MKTPLSGEVFILGDFLKFRVAYNYGIAFGLPVNYYLLIALYIIVLIGLVWIGTGYYAKKKYLQTVAILTVLLGAVSNLIDRLTLGKVIDYIDIKYFSVLNIADVMIVVGVIGLILWSYKSDK